MSREAIFANIRRGLKRSEPEQSAREAALKRIAARAPNLIPARAQGSEDEQIALFKKMALSASAELVEISNPAQLPELIRDRLAEQSINELVRGSSDLLEKIDWSIYPELTVRSGIANSDDKASLTECFAGIAETGTLMLHSQPESPTTLNFLPDIHLVLLRASQIVGVYEDAWKRLREARSDAWPRTVNLITGPSRSADIGQVLHMGAHGPCYLTIYLLDDRT